MNTDKKIDIEDMKNRKNDLKRQTVIIKNADMMSSSSILNSSVKKDD
jgi:hypothetical protein